MLPLALAMDGELVDAASAAVSPLDRTASFGDGLFETLRVVGSQVRHAPLHLARLVVSAARMQLPVPAAADIVAVTDRVVTAARRFDATGDLRIKWMFTRGIASWADTPSRASAGHWVVWASAALPPPATLRLACVDLPLPRRHQPAMKTMAYLDAITAKQLALAAGADEAIRLDWQGLVAEGAAVNLFALHGKVLSTAPVAGIVAGVVRHLVLRHAPALGLSVREVALSPAQFGAADECFATSAMIGVCPVVEIDGMACKQGPWSRRIFEEYAKHW